jgi:hypothetical protein
MSTATQPNKATRTEPGSITLISHSMLFYWWPVWVLGFFLGFFSLVSGYRMAIVPEGTSTKARADGQEGKTYELVVPAKAAERWKDLPGRNDTDLFSIPVMASRNGGVLFGFVLLAVIFATNVPLRGLWSAIVVLLLLLVIGLLAALGLWDKILTAIAGLDIYITAAGYLALATVTFLLWLVIFLFFDPKRYITFTPGQLIVHREIGDQRQVFDTTAVTVQKLQSDFFRHVLLGFYPGDIIIQTQGMQSQTFILPNVLLAAKRVDQIAALMRTRIVLPDQR